MFKYKYRKYWIICVLLTLAISTTIAYHCIESRWLDFRRAEKYYKEGRYSKALEFYVEVLKKDLNPKFYIAQLLSAAKITNTYEPIVKIYNKCIKKNPDNEEIIEGFADFYVHFKKYDEAAKVLSQYLGNHPDDYYIRLELARVYSWNDNYEKSILEYRKVLSNGIHDIRLDEYRVKLEFVKVLTYAEKYDQAIDLYKQLIFEKSRDWEVYIELANVYLTLKDYHNVFETLIEIPYQELDESSQIYLADLYAYYKHYDTAQEIYENYLEKHSYSTNVYRKYSNMRMWSKDEKISSEILDKITYFYSQKDEVLDVLAKDYIFARRFDEAIKTYKHLIQRSKKDDPCYLIELGDIYLTLDEKGKAIEYFQKAYGIDPFDDKLKRKFALTLAWSDMQDRALPLLEELFEKNRKDQIVGIELIRAYVLERKERKAIKVLTKLKKTFPKSPFVLMEIGNMYARLGHALEAREVYQNLLNSTQYNGNIYFNYADVMRLWGKYYEAEKIYRKDLEQNPDNRETKFKLAWLLVNMKRYEEAEQIYKTFIFQKNNLGKAYYRLAKVKLLQRDLEQALSFANKSFVINPSDKNILVLSEALAKNNKKDEALSLLDEIESKRYRKQAAYQKGKIYLSENKKLAIDVFKKSLELYPDNIELYFYANFDKIKNEEFKNTLVIRAKNAEDLTKIAWNYSENNLETEAIYFFEKAIEKDEKYYPAKFGLAQNLAMNNKIEAVKDFDVLLKDFPEDYQILLWKARVLGWTKHFKESIEVYNILRSLNPNDPQIIREKARVAAWDKNIDLSLETYDKALNFSVDLKLYENLIPLSHEIEDINFKRDFDSLKNMPFYFGYERIKNNLNRYNLSKDQERLLEKALLKNVAKFNIQKSIYLERKAKYAYYRMHYIEANAVYKELIDFFPSNEEAIFDYAQTYCHLNLCNKARPLYQILVDDFNHSRAKIALERNKIKADPFFRFAHEFFQEAGRGDLDRVKRNRTDFNFGYYFSCKNLVTFTAHRWTEEPTYEKNTQIKDVENLKDITYDAYGYSIDFETTFSKYIGTSLGFRQKYYLKKFNTTNLGHLFLWFRAKDAAKVTLGFDRDNEIDNIFSLRNDVQINRLFLQSSSLIKRRLSIDALGEARIYSDNNLIDLFRLDLGYRLTPFPKIFKFEVRGEYRNSDKLNNFVFEGSDLVNIIHPYWTPNNYKAFLASFSWYHDLSLLQFCEAEKHYYEFKLSTGTDTEKNPTITFYGGWHLEFRKKGLISINGYITRSKIWDASSVWAEYKYSF